MEIDKRIGTLIEILGLTPGEFADKINVQRSSISHITSARNKPSLDFLERTLSVFPDISSDWLILGKGKPLRSQFEEIKKNIDSNKENAKISEKQSPMLFPIEEEEESESLKNDFSTKNTMSENPVKINSSTIDLFTENMTTKKSENKKKEIKKIFILYEDNTFEVFEN